MHKMTQMGPVFNTEGEDMIKRTVTSEESWGPAVSTIMEALQLNSNQKV
jgi:hypothetical protein